MSTICMVQIYFIFPVANITVCQEEYKMLIKESNSTSWVNNTAYWGISVSHSDKKKLVSMITGIEIISMKRR